MGSTGSRSVCEKSAKNKDSHWFYMNNWVCSAETLVKTDKESRSDSDSDKQSDSLDLSLTDNLMRLPSAIMERVHHIRRVETNLDSTEEKLARVKRRARVVREIVAAENVPLVSNTTLASSLDSYDTRALRGATPHDFVYLRLLGTGATGTVVLVRHKSTQKLYAMKIVSKQSIREKNLVAKILSERDILGGTQHPLLVHLHCAFQTAHDLLLVMEYCSGGEISAHLQMFGRFPERVARFYAAQLILAIEHLHRHGIVYRDLKPENILLTGNGHLKLIDFGLSKYGITEANNGASTLCGSWEYVAPEVIKSCEYGSAVDWWSFGAVLYEFLTGLPPWYCENMKKMRQNILNCRLQFPRYVSPEAQDLIRGLLVINPSKRLGTAHGSMEIKQHPFFRNTDWEMMCFQEVQPPMKPIEHDPSNVESGIASLPKSLESTTVEKPHDEFHDFDFMPMTISHIELGHTLDHGEKHVIVCRASMTSTAS